MALLERTRRFYPDPDAFRGERIAGRRNPAWTDGDKPRFVIYVRGYEPHDEPDWQYQLGVIDMKYLGDEAYPIDAVAAGRSWDDAFGTAGDYIRQALGSDTNVFY